MLLIGGATTERYTGIARRVRVSVWRLAVKPTRTLYPPRVPLAQNGSHILTLPGTMLYFVCLWGACGTTEDQATAGAGVILVVLLIVGGNSAPQTFSEKYNSFIITPEYCIYFQSHYYYRLQQQQFTLFASVV